MLLRNDPSIAPNALEMLHDNALYKFSIDIDIDAVFQILINGILDIRSQ